jgi:hypothetical protein
MKELLLVVIFFGFYLALSVSAVCTPVSTTSVMVHTCGAQGENGPGRCENGTRGFFLHLVGGQSAPNFVWKVLRGGGAYVFQFDSLYQADSDGNMIDGTTMSLKTFDWTYCQAVLIGDSYFIEVYGVSTRKTQPEQEDMVINITGTIVNSADTTSFKWSLEITNYNFAPSTSAQDLVLYAKYNKESGSSDAAHEGGNNQVENGASFIDTPTTAAFNNDTISVEAFSQNNEGKKGYFVKFDLASSGLPDSFDLFLDPTNGIKTRSSDASSLMMHSVVLLVTILALLAL